MAHCTYLKAPYILVFSEEQTGHPNPGSGLTAVRLVKVSQDLVGIIQ